MLSLKGFLKPVHAFSVVGACQTGKPGPVVGVDPNAPTRERSRGPLSEREQEVASLIAQGCSNREIATTLVIAEASAVRHVANILNKLGLKSRAKVAVWAVERGLGSGHPR